MKQFVIIAIISILFFQQCHSESPTQPGSKPPEHDGWTRLLSKYVDAEGNVDYKGFKKDSIHLKQYLKLLVTSPPDENTWTIEEQIAYWINLYNAFTIKLIIDHYPIKSIKDIGSKIQIPFINSPWDIKLIEIEGEKYDLNNIEHSILRKKFNEPRIHFAIVCASYSCPKLRAEAYTADSLDQQLNEQAVSFINDPKRNRIKKSQAELSEIFNWFRSDFTKNGSLVEYLNQYTKTKLNENAKISFMDYDWSLNELR